MLLARAILSEVEPALGGAARAARFLLHRLGRLLHLPGPERLLVGAQAQRDFEAGSSRRRARRASRMLRGHFPDGPAGAVRSRCWTTSASRRSSCARRACWRTTTATPSPASTRASSAPTRARRASGLDAFMDAVRTVYASTMSREALTYRARRGLLDRDEQMALLVQRVSGAALRPLLLSRRSPAWASPSTRSSGTARSTRRPASCAWCSASARAPWTARTTTTRASSRSTRRCGCPSPTRKRRASTRSAASTCSTCATTATSRCRSSRSRRARRTCRSTSSPGATVPCAKLASEPGSHHVFPWVLQFEELLGHTEFVPDMREMLATLEAAYAAIRWTSSSRRTSWTSAATGSTSCSAGPSRCAAGPGRWSCRARWRRSVSCSAPAARSSATAASRRSTASCTSCPQTYGVLPMQDRVAVAHLVGRDHPPGRRCRGRDDPARGPGALGDHDPGARRAGDDRRDRHRLGAVRDR